MKKRFIISGMLGCITIVMLPACALLTKDKKRTFQFPPAVERPYSTAVSFKHTTYISGLLGTELGNGKLVWKGTGDELRQIFVNLDYILSRNGLNKSNIVKSTVFLTDIDDLQLFNEIYSNYFSGQIKPARTLVCVQKLSLGASVEIDFVACR